MSRNEMKDLGWEECDFVIVSGDVYIDHPSFGAAVIGRVLEASGYRVGIIAQPDWRSPDALQTLGRPRLAFLITAGNMDSMVNHYTAAGKLRHDDAYSPGGRHGMRPDRAALVYGQLARRAYKGVPVILGGIEASLRGLAHYDYWSNKLRKSLLPDAKADLIVYGMAERTIVKIADLLAAEEPLSRLRGLRGIVYRVSRKEWAEQKIDEQRSEEQGPEEQGHEAQGRSEHEFPLLFLPSFEELGSSKESFARGFALQSENADPHYGKALVEEYEGQYVVKNPPDFPLGGDELDAVYELPYARAPHPSYSERIPAFDEVRFSLVSSRGCFGGCSFCALTFHQGRIVQGRSHESLLREARELMRDNEFKGYIHDVGGPTANFRLPACEKQEKSGACPQRQCLYPEPCPSLKPDHSDYLELLRKLRSMPGVKKVFVRSGVRFDYLLADSRSGDEFLEELCRHHISGQLKVAPEHVSDRVLAHMGKPKVEVYKRFVEKYEETNRRIGKKQYIVPYFISSHPGSTLEDAVELAEFCRDSGFTPQQTQEFYPTPGTVATCMYYTGIDPRSMKQVHVPWRGRDRKLQRALLHYRKRENRQLVREALEKVGRSDLIGKGARALVPPDGNTAETKRRSARRSR